MLQYNDTEAIRDRIKANFRNVVNIKYTSANVRYQMELWCDESLTDTNIQRLHTLFAYVCYLQL